MRKKKLMIITTAMVVGLTPLTAQASTINLNAGVAKVELKPLTREELAQQEFDDIEYLMEEDKAEYLHRYFEIIAKYEFAKPQTIYDVYSQEEIDLFARLVEAEATEGDVSNKANIASVVFNRMYSEDFPDTITEVINQRVSGVWQFSPNKDHRINNEPTEDSYKAIEYVFMFGDVTDGALYFDCAKNSWSSKNNELIFNDGLHSFYK